MADINEDFQLLLKASEEDDKKDDDKDGIADVDQMVRADSRGSNCQNSLPHFCPRPITRTMMDRIPIPIQL